MENNKRYMLIAQTDTGFFEIDWTKLKGFKNVYEERHQLHLIDIFTKNYNNRNELIIDLVEHNMISSNRTNVKIKILPFIETNNEIIYDKEPLLGEVVFNDTYQLLYNVDNIMTIFLELIKDNDFCNLLQNHYLIDGKFSYSNLLDILTKLYHYEQLLSEEPDNKLIFDLYCTYKNIYKNINSSYSVLLNILAYNQSINNNREYSKEQVNVIEKNAYEFIIRELYNVIDVNDKGEFVMIKNEYNQNKLNYLQMHQLCMLIQEHQLDKTKSIGKLLQYKKSNNNYVLDGQLPLTT